MRASKLLLSAAAKFRGNGNSSCNAMLCSARSFSSSASSSPAEPSQAPASPAVAQSSCVGQPTGSTHPELMDDLELTPGILAAEYSGRRQRLADLLATSCTKGALVVVPAGSTQYMAGIIPYNYRQDPDFLYLTGLNQHAVAVIHVLPHTPKGEPQGHRFILFIEPPNPERARWDGERLDHEAASGVFGAHEVCYMHEIPRRLGELAASSQHIFFDNDRINGHQYSTLRQTLTMAAPAAPAGGNQQQQPHQRQINQLRPLLQMMRLQKSPSEAGLMRASAALAANGLRRCMEISHPGVPEHVLAATFEYECKVRGAQRMAFPAVTAGGPDACTIHYSRNDKLVPGGQMVLMDAGCELHGYCSDVTRTWPVDGKFTGPQRDVYSIVLDAHRRCAEACRPGSSIRELHHLSVKIISEGIRDLGLVPGASINEIMSNHYRKFYWHSLGHWLGMDTHDTPLMGHDRGLRPGNIITIEPGLYIPDDPGRYGPFAGIGVRIEDDVLVTQQGCEVLSRDVPTAIDEVQALVGSGCVRPGSSSNGLLGGHGPWYRPWSSKS